MTPLTDKNLKAAMRDAQPKPGEKVICISLHGVSGPFDPRACCMA